MTYTIKWARMEDIETVDGKTVVDLANVMKCSYLDIRTLTARLIRCTRRESGVLVLSVTPDL